NGTVHRLAAKGSAAGWRDSPPDGELGQSRMSSSSKPGSAGSISGGPRSATGGTFMGTAAGGMSSSQLTTSNSGRGTAPYFLVLNLPIANLMVGRPIKPR